MAEKAEDYGWPKTAREEALLWLTSGVAIKDEAARELIARVQAEAVAS